MYTEKNTHTVSEEFSKKKQQQKLIKPLKYYPDQETKHLQHPRNPCYSPNLHPTQLPKVGSIQNSNTGHSFCLVLYFI